MWQAGLGLPDRDFYWDAKLKDKLSAYAAHVDRMLTLAGVANPKQTAADIVAFETRLAKAHWSKIDNRDSTKTYNKKTRDELARLAPGLDWNLYLDALGAKDAQEVIVAQPSYATALAALLDSVPLDTWKAWMKWNAIRAYAGLLNREMADASFDFYGRTLHGIRRTVRAGSGPSAPSKVRWAKRWASSMSPSISRPRPSGEWTAWWRTSSKPIAGLREQPLAKPPRRSKRHWPSSRRFARRSATRTNGATIRRSKSAATIWWATCDGRGRLRVEPLVGQAGQPVDRDEWHMTPQTVNAYYNPNMNEVVFPAAILQPPFFNLEADEAVNYGGIGAVIAHEIGHGFDDQGSKWDGTGNLAEWWTPADRAEFDRRGSVLVDQFSQFEPLPGFKVNGRFTLGENIADLCGLTLSHAAYRASLGDREAAVIDGLTGDQRFFMGFAQVWRCKYRDEDLKNRLVTDPHSPAECRANGAPRNVDAFHSAFGIRPGDKMYLPPEERVKIW